MNTTPHYKKGTDTKIAVVLSCPGKAEEKAKEPAKAQTGVNLKNLLSILSDENGLSDFKKDTITITNAWDKVEYKKLTERTEATAGEVMSSSNLERLAQEIKHISDYIVCCGERAKEAVYDLKQRSKLNADCKILEIPHLGNQGLNRTIETDIHGKDIMSSYSKPTNRRKARLKVVAKRLLENI